MDYLVEDIAALHRKAHRVGFAHYIRKGFVPPVVVEVMAATQSLEAFKQHVLAEGKYSPDQPRVPAGNPDGGQWTSGGGDGSGDDALAVEDTHNTVDGMGRVLQNLFGIGTAHAEDSGSSTTLLSQPPAGQDPGATQAMLNNGQPVTYKGPSFEGNNGQTTPTGATLVMPQGISLSNNAALGEKLSLMPSVFTPGGKLPTLSSGLASLPAKEAAMTALFAPSVGLMDYQRNYSNDGNINRAYINFGNYNYGVVAAAAGYDLDQALFASGIANLWGSGNHTGAMFNNPANIPWIKQGFSDYMEGLIGAP